MLCTYIIQFDVYANFCCFNIVYTIEHFNTRNIGLHRSIVLNRLYKLRGFGGHQEPDSQSSWRLWKCRRSRRWTRLTSTVFVRCKRVQNVTVRPQIRNVSLLEIRDETFFFLLKNSSLPRRPYRSSIECTTSATHVRV